MEIVLTAKNFADEVLKSKTLVLVDFWAEWCMPCQYLEPTIAEIAKEYEGKLKVGKINVDENPELVSTYQISSIPNLKIFKNGKVIDEIIGALSESEIKKFIQKHL